MTPNPLTPYGIHDTLGHHMTTWSPNGIDIIEECTDCGARWLHSPAIGYPVTLRCLPDSQLETT